MENGTKNDKMMDLQWYERAAVLRNTFDNNAHITAGACSGVISQFDKFWFFLLLSRLLTRSWQVSGQTLVEGIWLVAVSQSRWFLNCNHSRVITMIIIAIAVSQTRLRYNVDNVDGRQWLPNELHITWPRICQVLAWYLPSTCQVLSRYFLGTCQILDMSWRSKVIGVHLPSWLVSRQGWARAGWAKS